MNFIEAFDRTLGREGGFQQMPNDRGNWTGGEINAGELRGTKYGISAAAYPTEDIRNLTVDRARALYLRDYWGPVGCDAMPEEIRADLFDMAVHAGVRRAIRAVQEAVGETQDGVLGPRTLQAVQSMPVLRLVARFNGARLAHLTTLPTWPAFGRGWCKRLADNLLEA